MAVRVTVRPQQVYIERASSAQLLNFDFLLEKHGDYDKAYDAKGASVRRRS